MSLLLALLQGPEMPRSVWPDTIAGWLSIVLSFAAVAMLLIGWGRLLEKLNGFGKRQQEFEEKVLPQVTSELKTVQGSQQELHTMVQNTLRAQDELLERLGRAEAKSEACDDAVTKVGIDLGARIHALVKQISDQGHSFELALRELLTELRTRNLIGPGAQSPGSNTTTKRGD